ncbi:Lsr2 family protein [Dietzia sp. CQ4]|uniref:histone-like nucleoid-structuring protein Lsr2 n=1 Tax=Dietzia sp. (strain CQ4) TaxID=370437 RepID=UPI0015FD8059|nr:Lsr2 family protein [Dietzia sp. CQ4]MBB1033622.1 Lsr2 family protein [Dietzia sp. CQ4]
MAQLFQIRYLDDIDGTDLGDKANTLFFAFDGKEYSIDLSGENADTFHQVMAPYIAAGQRVSKTKSSRRATTKTSSGDTTAIREWARDNGHDLSDRGRIPAAVMDAYVAAN